MYETPKIPFPYTKIGLFVYETPKIPLPYTKTGLFVYEGSSKLPSRVFTLKAIDRFEGFQLCRVYVIFA